MLPEQQLQLLGLIGSAVQSAAPDATPNVLLERPKVASHGDVATNVAMQIAKPLKRNPRELAAGHRRRAAGPAGRVLADRRRR